MIVIFFRYFTFNSRFGANEERINQLRNAYSCWFSAGFSKLGRQAIAGNSIGAEPFDQNLIESKGIPYTAIFKLEINGREETPYYNLQKGDRIKAYPFESVDKNQFDFIYSKPSAFIADVHLGKLVTPLIYWDLIPALIKIGTIPPLFSNQISS